MPHVAQTFVGRGCFVGLQRTDLGCRLAAANQDRSVECLPAGGGQQRRSRGLACRLRCPQGSRTAGPRRPAAEYFRQRPEHQHPHQHRPPQCRGDPQRHGLSGNPEPADLSRRPLVPVAGRRSGQRTGRAGTVGHRAEPDPAIGAKLFQCAARAGQSSLDQG